MNAHSYIDELAELEKPLGHHAWHRRMVDALPPEIDNGFAGQHAYMNKRNAWAGLANLMLRARHRYEADSKLPCKEKFKQRPNTEAKNSTYTIRDLCWNVTCNTALADVFRNDKSNAPYSQIKGLGHLLPISKAQRWNYKGLHQQLRYEPMILQTAARINRDDDLSDNERGCLGQYAIQIARIAEVSV